MNRVIQFVIACCFSLGAFAASPGFESFNVNQFDVTGKRVALKDGLQITNLVLFGSSSNLLEVWNSDNELKFWIDTNGFSHPDLWTNSAGTIQASSTVAAGADSVGFKLDSLNTLTAGDDIVQFHNHETRHAGVGYNGMVYSGDRSTNFAWMRYDPIFQQSEFQGVITNGAYYWIQNLNQYASGTNTVQTFSFTRDVQTIMVLDPSGDFGLTTRYLFDTSDTVPSGNLFEVRNNTTNVFVIPWNGAVLAPSMVVTNITVENNITVKGNAVLNVVTSNSQTVSNNLTVLGNYVGTIDPAQTGTTLKQIKSLKLQFPRLVDGAGCAYANTNDYTALTFMLPQFSGTAATNVNFCQFAFRVPKDLDTSVDLTGSLTIRLTAADTAAHAYTVGMVSIANSSSAAGTAANYATLTVAADGSGASGDIENVNDVTLSGWRSAMTAGQWCLVQLQRDGSDSSTVASNLMELEIFYTSTQ